MARYTCISIPQTWPVWIWIALGLKDSFWKIAVFWSILLSPSFPIEPIRLLSLAIRDPRSRYLVPLSSYGARAFECGVFCFIVRGFKAVYASRDRVFPVAPLRKIGLYMVSPAVGADILHAFLLWPYPRHLVHCTRGDWSETYTLCISMNRRPADVALPYTCSDTWRTTWWRCWFLAFRLYLMATLNSSSVGPSHNCLFCLLTAFNISSSLLIVKTSFKTIKWS